MSGSHGEVVTWTPRPRSPPPSNEPPYYGPPAYYAPAPAPRHRGSRWRWGLAGGIAGGLIAAAVAVPVTLQLADQGTTSSAAGSPSAGNGLLPGNLPNTLPGGPDGSGGTGDPGGSDGSGGFGTQPGAETQASGTPATEAQSQGVLLVESTLTNGSGAGTAMVLDSSGLALTNYHVVENSTQIRATVAATGATYDASVVGFDEKSDVALIQLDGASGLDTVTLDQAGVDVGDAVTGVGNALGQRHCWPPPAPSPRRTSPSPPTRAPAPVSPPRR